MTRRLLPDHWEWGDVAAVVVGVAVILGFGVSIFALRDAPLLFCRAEYERATTAADTARVDAIFLGGRHSDSSTNCGRLRALGRLDRLEPSAAPAAP